MEFITKYPVLFFTLSQGLRKLNMVSSPFVCINGQGFCGSEMDSVKVTADCIIAHGRII